MKIKGFRLSDETQSQILWLAQRKGVTATDVIRLAVAALYQEEMAKLPRFRLDGNVLLLNNQPVIRCNDTLLSGLPEDLLIKLDNGTAEPMETMLYLILNAARVGEGFEYDQALLDQTLGWNLSNQEKQE